MPGCLLAYLLGNGYRNGFGKEKRYKKERKLRKKQSRENLEAMIADTRQALQE